MPKGIYSNLKCKVKSRPLFNPTSHQKETVKAFLKSRYKGMLLYHKLGSGKTCTSILIADKLLKKGKIDRVYILSPGSLRSGWRNEYCRVCGLDSKYMERYFTFITYNYSVGKDLPDFRRSLVIIDEVHNLINGAKNQSFNFTKIYDELLSTDCRILALSGTPIYNYVYEFALLGNLLKPGAFPEIRTGGEELDTYSFNKLFIIQGDGTLVPKNSKSIKRKLEGIISYYPGEEKYMPKIIEQPPIKTVMTEKQELYYWDRAEQEMMLSRPPSKSLLKKKPEKYELLKRLYIMAKKNILVRAVSNFYYPPEFRDDEDIPARNDGWVDSDQLKNGELYKIYSTKFTAVILNIVMHNKQKHVLFSFFKTKSGVILLRTLLRGCGITAEIFSGDMNDYQRKELLKRFNSEKNIRGDDIRVLLVTEAGAEGISVTETRHMHILESSPRMSKTVQAIGRVARYKSHMRLPENERNVKIWRYWSIAREDPVYIRTSVYKPDGTTEEIRKKISNKECIDEKLYERGMRTVNEINSFLDILKESSVTEIN